MHLPHEVIEIVSFADGRTAGGQVLGADHHIPSDVLSGFEPTLLDILA